MVDALKWHSIRSLRELRSFRMDYTRNIAIGKHTSSLWLFCSFPLFKHWGMTTSEIEGTTQALNVCRRFPFFRNTLLSFTVDVSRSFLPAFLPPRRISRRYKLESTKRRTALFLFLNPTARFPRAERRRDVLYPRIFLRHVRKYVYSWFVRFPWMFPTRAIARERRIRNLHFSKIPTGKQLVFFNVFSSTSREEFLKMRVVTDQFLFSFICK